MCDKLLFVEAPRAVRLERLAHKHGWNEKEVAAAREEMQMDLSAKKARAIWWSVTARTKRQGPDK